MNQDDTAGSPVNEGDYYEAPTEEYSSSTNTLPPAALSSTLAGRIGVQSHRSPKALRSQPEDEETALQQSGYDNARYQDIVPLPGEHNEGTIFDPGMLWKKI